MFIFILILVLPMESQSSIVALQLKLQFVRHGINGQTIYYLNKIKIISCTFYYLHLNLYIFMFLMFCLNVEHSFFKINQRE